MKHTRFATAILLIGLLAATSFPAHDPNLLDLDGREVTLMFYEGTNSYNRKSYTRSAVLAGNTIKLDFNDVKESTRFMIHADHQKDDIVRLAIGDGFLHQSRYKKGLEISLPKTPPQLGGRKVAVRAYKDWQNHPETYENKNAMIFGRTVRFDFADVNDSAVVVIVGQEQQDRQIKGLLGKFVYGWAYKQGLEFRLPKDTPADANHFCWTFIDALGNPMPNGAVQLYLMTQDRRRAFIDDGVADANARFTTPFCVSGTDARLGVTRFGGTAHLFVFSHPQYGTAETRIRGAPKGHRATVTLPFVPSGSEAALRSTSGFVVDPNGVSVSGALVEPLAVSPPGARPIYRSGDYCVRTNAQGSFTLYMLVAESNEKIGTFIPPNSRYSLRIIPPRGLGLLDLRTEVPSGKEKVITLERPQTRFHTFVFKNDAGTIQDLDTLRRIRVNIDRADKPGLSLKYDDWKTGGLFPMGTYTAYADISPFVSYPFEPIEVSTDSPEQLVFSVPVEDKRYYGQVVDGTTGRPMVGAFVIDMRSTCTQLNLAMLTDADWNALRQMLDEPSKMTRPRREILKPVGDCYFFSKIVRTDANGWFDFTVPPKRDFAKVVVFQQNYLTFITDVRKCTREDKSSFRVPLTKLFPAATVVVEPWIEELDHDRSPSLWPECVFEKTNNPAWIDDLLAAWNVEGATFMDDIRNDYALHINKKCTFPIPADLYLQIQLRPLYDDSEQWSPVTVAETLRLRQGQTLDLGRVQIPPTVVVWAQTLNSASLPVEGVPVIAVDRYGKKTSNTDENGIAVFRLPADSIGEFVVEYKEGDEPDAPQLREAIPYGLMTPEDVNTVYTIQLSDRMLQSLFNQ